MLGRLSSWLASLPLALCCSHCVSCARDGSLAERRRCGLVLAQVQIHRHQASMLQFDNLSIFPFELWSFPYFLILPVPTFIVSLSFNHPGFLPLLWCLLLCKFLLSLCFKRSMELWIQLLEVLQVPWESLCISTWLWNEIIFNLLLFLYWHYLWLFLWLSLFLLIFNGLNGLSNCHLLRYLSNAFWHLWLLWFWLFLALIITAMWLFLLRFFLIVIRFFFVSISFLSGSLNSSLLSVLNVFHCCNGLLLLFS